MEEYTFNNINYTLNVKLLTTTLNIADKSVLHNLKYDFYITYKENISLPTFNVGLHVVNASQYYNYNYTKTGYPNCITITASNEEKGGKDILKAILNRFDLYTYYLSNISEYRNLVISKYASRIKYATTYKLSTLSKLKDKQTKWKTYKDELITNIINKKLNHITSLSIILNIRRPQLSNRGILNDRTARGRINNNKKHGYKQYKHYTCMPLNTMAVYINLFDSYTYNGKPYRLIDLILKPVSLSNNRKSNTILLSEMGKMWDGGETLNSLTDPNNPYYYYYMDDTDYGKIMNMHTWYGLLNMFKLKNFLGNPRTARNKKKNKWAFRRTYCKYIQYKFLMGYFDPKTAGDESPIKNTTGSYINTHNFKCYTSYLQFYFCNYMTMRFTKTNLDNTAVKTGKESERHTIYVKNHVNSFRGNYCTLYTDKKYYLKDQYKDGCIFIDYGDTTSITDDDLLLFKDILKPIPDDEHGDSHYAIFTRSADASDTDYKLLYYIINGEAIHA